MRRAGSQLAVLTVFTAIALSACSSAAPTGAEAAATPAMSDVQASAPAQPASPDPSAEPSEPPQPEPTRFHGTIARLPAGLAAEMRGTTWKPGCPVQLSDLRLVRFSYVAFDGEIERGPMVVNKDVAEDVLWVFKQLFRAEFAIKRVDLAKEFVPSEFEPVITSKRSVTASFNCRPVVTPLGPGDDFSQHSYGLAIDINPVQNPFVASDGFVRNTEARRYVDRSKRLPGMIHTADVVVRSFEAIGWEWGGSWSGGKDYMHFSQSGT